MTDEKKKTEKKADDLPEQTEKKLLETPQPSSEENKEEIISEKPLKEDDAVKTEEKPDVKKEEKPVEQQLSEHVSAADTDTSEKKQEQQAQDVKAETPKSKEGKTEKSEQHTKEKAVEPKSKKAVTEKKKSAKKQDEKDEDFQYIVRIANTDIDGDKTLVMGIAQIKGIGRHMAVLIADSTGIDKKTKMGKLTEPQIEKIKKALEEVESIAPGWMLNHRKDIDTGKDIHLIGADVELRLRDDVNLLKMIRSYRGIRHESGLAVRGQRTRGNNRRGLALGVSKKRPGA